MLSYYIIDLLRSTNVVNEYLTVKKEISKGHDFLEDNKREKLVQLFKNISTHPFYKEFLSGYDENTIKADPLKVLNGLPVISKQHINNHKGWYRENNAKGQYEKRYTGGSTGSPFNYYLSKHAISRITAFNYYLWNYFLGYKIGDKILTIGGNSLGQNSSFKIKLYNFLQRKIFISGDVIDETELTSVLHFITESSYDLIYAYPSSLEFFVDEAVKRNMSFRKKIKGIVTTSEMLSPVALEKFRSFFKCDVMNCYGARDGGIIGCELKSKGDGFYHNFYDCIAESKIVDERLGKPELLLTNLYNYSFPFVRYRVGDIGAIETFNSNFLLPLNKIVQLQGRTRDLIYTHSNKVIHGSAFNTTMKGVPAVDQYQIVQNADFNIEVRIKSDNNLVSEQHIIELIRSLVTDPTIDIKVSVNREFVLSQNQKHKTVVSYVS